MVDAESKIDRAPLVSVLMPCYNHEAYVINSLESVVSSDYKWIEFIFIDDASQDNSFNLAKKWLENNKDRFVRTVCIQHKENRGICATLNELYVLSRGEFINYLASDDNLLSDGLSKQINFAIKNNVDFVFSDLRLIDEAGELICDSAMQYFCKNGKKLKRSKICLIVDIIFKWNPPWNKFFMSSELVKKIGLCDDSLSFEDRDFVIRVLANGSFALMLDTTTDYRIRLNNRLTPGLEQEAIINDFRKADYKNYFNSSGIVRFFLGILVHSYKNKSSELEIENAIFASFSTRIANLLKRLIIKIHQFLM